MGPVELAPAAAGVDLKAFVLPFSAKSLHPRGPTPSRGLEPANLTRLLPTPSSHDSRDLIFTFQIPPTTSNQFDSKSTSSASGVDDKLIIICHRKAPSPYEAFRPRAIYAALLHRRTLPIRDRERIANYQHLQIRHSNTSSLRELLKSLRISTI